MLSDQRCVEIIAGPAERGERGGAGAHRKRDSRLKALPRKEQQAVLRRVIQDEKLRRDLMDMALIENRRTEPARSLREYLKESRKHS